MKIGITLKLFLAFFVTIIIVVATMAVAVRYSFHYGFLDYVNRVEVQRLDTLAVTIAEEYEKFGDWKFVKFKRGMWHRLIVTHLRTSNGEKVTFNNLDEEKESVEDSEPPLDLTDLGLRLALLDSNKEFVAGNRQFDPSAVMKPIISKGETVGWLSITPSTELMDTVDIQFREQQNNTAIVISILSLFVAAGIAVILSKQILRPIRRLVLATRRLISGNYDTRISVTNYDEMGELQKYFNTLANTLEKNEKSRQQWIADISHELRTPMSILLGEVEAIQDGVRSMSQHNLKSLHSEILRVNKLIDDLYQLSMSDIGALDYKKSETELTEIIDTAISLLEDRIRSKDITASVDMSETGPIYVFADSQRLHQLFINLLENTLRYTNPGGKFEVRCEKNNDNVVIHWFDSEPGVPDEQLDKLFDRLFRAEGSRSRASGGAGLGLSLCKNIVEAHDGEITVKHSPLGGLWFQITLPTIAVKSHWRNDAKVISA